MKVTRWTWRPKDGSQVKKPREETEALLGPLIDRELDNNYPLPTVRDLRESFGGSTDIIVSILKPYRKDPNYRWRDKDL